MQAADKMAFQRSPTRIVPRTVIWVTARTPLLVLVAPLLLVAVFIWLAARPAQGAGQPTSLPASPLPAFTSTDSPTQTMAPSLTPAATATPQPPTATRQPVRQNTPNAKFWDKCNASYHTNLKAGAIVKVNNQPAAQRPLREGPYITRAIIAQIDPGEILDIVEGPSCSNNWIWWKVISRKDGQTGWSPERDNSNAWLLPSH